MNANSVFYCCKTFAQYMMLQRAGRIINLSSIAAVRGGKGQSNYAASKGAINAFTRALAVELASKSICVNAVAPGMIETEMSEKVRSAYGKRLLASIPGRWGQPKWRVILLAGDAS
jgi:3-oxoacyl-[acyl-carrier protein] reductase